MKEIQFDWDPRKNADNKRKHGVSFEEAMTVFSDERALFMADPDHSAEEDRFLLLGLSSLPRTLVVCHCFRQSDQLIRIMSARKATQPERQQYNLRWKT